MEKGTITLSFDDGRSDNYNAIKEVLMSQKLSSTLNIASAYIDGRLKVLGGGYNPPPLTKEKIVELHNSGFVEISSHGQFHKNDINDIKNGRIDIINWLSLESNYKIGFASPGSMMDYCYIQKNIEYFEKDFLYIRTGANLSKNIWMVLLRKINRVLHIPFLTVLIYKKSMQIDAKDNIILSVPIFFNTTISEMRLLIKYAIRNKLLLTLNFHSVKSKGLDGYGSLYTYDFLKFTKIANYLSMLRDKGLIEVKTTQEIIRE